METIGVGQSIVITIFSMLVVFLVLVGISFLIDLLRLAVERLESKGNEEKITDKKLVEDVKEEVTSEASDLSSDEELVAVISAAIAASMGVDLPDIRINSIRRIDDGWKNRARDEQVFKNI